MDNGDFGRVLDVFIELLEGLPKEDDKVLQVLLSNSKTRKITSMILFRDESLGAEDFLNVIARVLLFFRIAFFAWLPVFVMVIVFIEKSVCRFIRFNLNPASTPFQLV